ncbi:MAG: response regulator [Myxococcales bacterium]|nr:response regulator [Myxococcales bacterium]
MRRDRILVVDDEARNRRLLETILTAAGYDVLEADSGEAALVAVASERADLVLLDVHMPGLDGIETCRRIRDELGRRLLPIVFVTGMGDRDVRVRGKEVGADDFLTKPIDDGELLARVRALLGVKSYHDLSERRRRHLEAELAERSEQLVDAERLARLGSLAAGIGEQLGGVGTVLENALGFVVAAAHAGRPAAAEDLAELARAAREVREQAAWLVALGTPASAGRTPVELRAVVVEALALLRSGGRLERCEVEVALPDQAVLVNVNRSQLEQVLLGVVVAVAGVDEAGADDVRHAPEGEDSSGRFACRLRIEVRASDSAPRVCFRVVADTRFARAWSERPPALGLTVARHLLASWGGLFALEDQVGDGCAVSFELPLAEVPARV